MTNLKVRVWVEGGDWDTYDAWGSEWRTRIALAMRYRLHWDFAFVNA